MSSAQHHSNGPIANLLYFTVVIQALLAGRTILRPHDRVGPDAVFFQYAGQVMANGGLPYRDLWDIKPPVTHEFAAVIALFVRRDPFWMTVVSVVLSSLAFVGIVWLISMSVYQWTENEYAAVAAGAVPFLLPKFYAFAARGLGPKLFVIVLGLLALQFYTRGRYTLTGVSAALSAGMWQFGAFFPVAILTHALVSKRWRPAGIAAIGMGVTTAVVMSPFILTNTVGIVVQQVVVAPMLITEQTTIVERVVTGGRLLLFTAPIIAVGSIVALVAPFKTDVPWWVAAGMGWFAVQIWIFDLDSHPDLFVGVVFAAFGVGVAVDRLAVARQRRVLAVGALIVGIMAIYGLMNGWFTASPTPLDGAPVVDNYWSMQMPETCHQRLSEVEVKYMEKIGSTCDISAF